MQLDRFTPTLEKAVSGIEQMTAELREAVDLALRLRAEIIAANPARLPPSSPTPAPPSCCRCSSSWSSSRSSTRCETAWPGHAVTRRPVRVSNPTPKYRSSTPDAWPSRPIEAITCLC